MAVTFDSTFEKGFNVVSSPNSFVSNAGTVTGTVGNNPNRILIAFIEMSNHIASSLSAACTWNGATMTLIANLDYSAGTRSVWLYGLINPDIGNNTLSFTWTPGANGVKYLGAVSLYNADQVTGWQNSGNDTGTSTAPSSTVTSAAGNMAVVGHGNDNASSTVINAGTSDWIDQTLTTNSAQGHLASVSGSSVVSWTLGSSVAWANLKVDVIASGGYTHLERGIRGLERGIAVGRYS